MGKWRFHAAFSTALAGLLLACAAAPRPKPIPKKCRTALAEAMRLGVAIHLQDEVSARATDAVLREKGRDPEVRGWVTTSEGSVWEVHFFGLEGSRAVERYTVRFTESSPQTPEVFVLEPPRPMTGRQAAMARARQSALAEPLEPRCSASYNTVVLPAALRGEEGWLVYLLAATAEPGVMLLGGHHRRTVSADGSSVLSSEPLSRTCLTLPPPRGEDEPYVTHLLSPCPIETHVYLSLLHRRPLYVKTSGGVYRVEGRRIPAVSPIGEP